jgi:hypothetical protein
MQQTRLTSGRNLLLIVLTALASAEHEEQKMVSPDSENYCTPQTVQLCGEFNDFF